MTKVMYDSDELIAKRDRNPESFASVAGEARECMEKFVGRLSSLTDSLCGGAQVPVNEASGATRGIPTGYFEEAAEHSRAVMLLIEAAGRHLDRIERALP